MKKQLTEDQRKKITELRGLGHSVRDTAAIVGCSKGSVFYYTHPDYRVAPSKIRGDKMGCKMDESVVANIFELHKSGVPYLQIASSVGVSYSTVARYINPKNRMMYREAKKRIKKEPYPLILKRERGNKCEACGYDKHTNCLDFHHKVPIDKKFGIAKSHTRSLEEARAEAAKCILVCKNCHALIHAGIIQITIDQQGNTK